MRTYPETLTENLTPKANWPLALCAGLLGIGQNGLLVMLPQLVTLTGLSLSVWAGLLMFGSMLFLPASPWWGRQSERHGCKVVMLASLSGYLASFVVMALVVWAMASGMMSAVWGLAGLILSRTLYGLTVSGLVPAAQTWAIQRAGLDKRMAALATISSGLSCGRLLGPPLAAMMLSVNPVAPPLVDGDCTVYRSPAGPSRGRRSAAAAGRTSGDACAGFNAAVPCAGVASGRTGEPDAAWPVTASQPSAGR